VIADARVFVEAALASPWVCPDRDSGTWLMLQPHPSDTIAIQASKIAIFPSKIAILLPMSARAQTGAAMGSRGPGHPAVEDSLRW
jgi:hypothetical protein